ncbi:MAG TPA: cupin domain-containing protein [Caulobacteraceae bacterium]|jgi:uncharacterized cupin superfamily protein
MAYDANARPILNLEDLDFRPWDEAYPKEMKPPQSYGARKAEVASRLGARKLGYNVIALEPGKAAYPPHNHRVTEEMFLILEGEGELTIGRERYPARKGDIIACPPGGPETAHQLRNTSAAEELKVLSLSTTEEADVVEYPQAGNVSFGVMQPGPDGKLKLFRHILKEGDDVNYWADA